ncbi:hypothetical protein GT346_27060, partial [Streptomyces sp. SID161]|nr:hypothetical protein [Streptomyces sp. SID161]
MTNALPRSCQSARVPSSPTRRHPMHTPHRSLVRALVSAACTAALGAGLL